MFHFVEEININYIKSLNKKINIIYRNYNQNYDKKKILLLKKLCKKDGRMFFLANNYKLVKKFRLDGLYIPSFNKSLIPINLKKEKNFLLLGSAHNLKEINIKKRQMVDIIFISPFFKIKKNYKFLGFIKFKILSNFFGNKSIALGGINENNFKNLCNSNIFGIASISFFKETKLKSF